MAYTEVGIATDGQPIDVGGLNPWDFEWVSLPRDPVELPHPQYRHQSHRMWHYAMTSEGRTVHFVAGEVSANAWAFYVVDPTE